MRIGFGGFVYLAIGLVVAVSHNYLRHLDTVNAVLSAALAIVLWPLIFLGIDLHVH